jgi:hypothetical protein
MPNTARAEFSREIEDVLGKRLRKEPSPLKTKEWRRGWDSDSLRVLTARKLLISFPARTPQSTETTEEGDTGGTRRALESLS